MITIAVMGQKGGIGKTTTATTLAYLLAEPEKTGKGQPQRGGKPPRRVLLIDADQQGNASQVMGRYDPDGPGLHNLLLSLNGEESVQTVAQRSPYFSLDVIPSNNYLADANAEIAADQVNDQARRLRRALHAPGVVYDYAVIDCGLVLDMAVINALVAADLWIIPMRPGGFEVDATDRMMEQLAEIRKLNPELEAAVLPVMVAKIKAHQQALQWIEGRGYRHFEVPVRRSIIAEKSTATPLPLPVYSPRCGMVEDYRAAVQAIERWAAHKQTARALGLAQQNEEEADQ